MKKLMLGTAIAVIFGASASAQDLFRTEMDPATIAASDFIGKRVYAVEATIDAEEYEGVQEGWNDIGEINDVILTRDGKVDAVLVDIGGFLGMGERQVAVGMENIRFVADSATPDELNDFFLVISADRSLLEGAPEYMRTGAMPVDGTDAAADTTADATVDPAADPAAEPMADTADATVDPTTEAAPAATDTEVAATDPAPEGGMADSPMVIEGYTAVDPASITMEQLVGMRVYGPNQEDVGEISELVSDASGTPAQVIVDVGGFLGIGEKPVLIDISALNIMKVNEGETMRAYVAMTQEELEALPSASK